MQTPCLTVIEGDNPDDRYTDRSHLRLVELTPTDTSASLPRPLLLEIVDGLIATLVRWQYSFEIYRVWLERRMVASNHDSSEPMIGRRGW